jgi:hypothetical protein
MVKLRVCPGCNGEGRRLLPPYGLLIDGKWELPADWNEHIDGGPVRRDLGPCNTCKQTGYLKVSK